MFKQSTLFISLLVLSATFFAGQKIIEIERTPPTTIASFDGYTPDKIGLCDGFMDGDFIEAVETEAAPVVASHRDFTPNQIGLCDGLPAPGELADEYPIDEIEVSRPVEAPFCPDIICGGDLIPAGAAI